MLNVQIHAFELSLCSLIVTECFCKRINIALIGKHSSEHEAREISPGGDESFKLIREVAARGTCSSQYDGTGFVFCYHYTA